MNSKLFNLLIINLRSWDCFGDTRKEELTILDILQPPWKAKKGFGLCLYMNF